jgi:predicted nucleotidyltransferase
MEDLIEITRRIFRDRYPTADVILLAGSLLRGEGTLYSDLDVIVIFDRLPHARRESFIFHGRMVEAFIHDPETLNYFLFESRRSPRSPATARMVAEGIEIPGPTESSRALKRIANEFLAAGPPEIPEEEERRLRYTITNLIDDIREPRSREELVASGAELYGALANYYFRENRIWPATDKTIPRALRRAEPELYTRYCEAFESLFADGRGDQVIALAEEILKQQGGFLFDGYQSDASPECRKPLA